MNKVKPGSRLPAELLARIQRKEWLTTPELARYLGVRPRQASTWAQRGAIPRRRLLDRWLIPTAELATWTVPKAGRPLALDPADIERLRAAVREGGDLKALGKELGLSYWALKHYVKRIEAGTL